MKEYRHTLPFSEVSGVDTAGLILDIMGDADVGLGNTVLTFEITDSTTKESSVNYGFYVRINVYQILDYLIYWSSGRELLTSNGFLHRFLYQLVRLQNRSFL